MYVTILLLRNLIIQEIVSLSGELMMKLKLPLTKLALAIIFLASLLMGIPRVSEAFGAYTGTEYHIPEPVYMLLFGIGLVWIARFGRKNLIKK